MSDRLTPVQFVEKWSRAALSERAASQEHFIDLCRLLGQPTPAEHDATGAEYTFEKGVTPIGGASKGAKGERGFADVWWRGKFAWEYKRKDKYRDLTEAYRQLCQYREALENPPLLVVSDIARTEVHTNFTGTAKQVHVIALDKLAERESLDQLRRVFADPESFKPTVTPEHVTEAVADGFAQLAQKLRDRGHDPHDAAHFLMKCMFCLFAEDVELLPGKLFERLLKSRRNDLAALRKGMTDLFERMRTGGAFGVDTVPHFNGGLFDESLALELKPGDVETLLHAAEKDWGSVEPAIFGTLFERSLDPNTRAQIGAHYTSRADIMLIVEPVILAPLRREWEEVKVNVDKQLERRGKSKAKPTQSKADKAIEKTIREFVHRLASVRILDPACGSGNFLYVAIQQLLDLEKEVITYAARPDIALGLIPQVRPTQLHGIEINPYAAELAQVVIWIGYLQWMRDNGFIAPRNPILEPIQTIENRDAILDLSDPRLPVPAQWPAADFIIGNPPFLGSSDFRRMGMQDDYVNALRSVYSLHGKSDLCCYWFARSWTECSRRPSLSVGLLATQAIRFGGSRGILDRIEAEGQIIAAWANRPWMQDGVAIRVSIVAFARSSAHEPSLNGVRVAAINSDLSAGVAVATAKALGENSGLSFEGVQKGGPFDIKDAKVLRQLLCTPNPDARSNVDVIARRFNAVLLVGNRTPNWIIDFGPDRPESDASLYEAPFEYVRRVVQPVRTGNRNRALRDRWWLHKCPRPEMRNAVQRLRRFLVTPRVSEHRLWSWLQSGMHPDSRLFVFARADDYLFGVLHSSVHELWSLNVGAVHGKGNDPTYNNNVCFERFPLPWPPGKEPTEHDAYRRISEAAKHIDEQRERWLNPPEWIEPIAKAVDAEDDFADVPDEARPLIRQSAIMARAATHPKLKKRTLTNVYNERPTWLRLAHEQLDRAVLAAYAAVDCPHPGPLPETHPHPSPLPEGEGVWSEDWAEVWAETGAGRPLPDGHSLAERRAEVDQKVLANLLRMNLARAGK